jgi:hypothetical protein
MIYMTDLQTSASNYCLLKIREYNKSRINKRLFFIDPGVYQLKTQNEYSQIQFIHELANGKLQSNEYLSADYPCDMLNMRDISSEEKRSLAKEFVEKSIANNWKYQSNPQYICAIQYDWMAQMDFEFRIKELESIYAYKKKVVALGNICRIMNPCKYLDFVFDYLLRNKEKFYWIHVYGMSKAAIKRYMFKLQFYAPKIILSADSTKWTRCPNKQIHAKYVKNPDQQQLFPTAYRQSGVGCTPQNRNEFFLANINDIKKRGIRVDY